MRAEDFQHEMVATTAVFGRKAGVQVVFAGDSAGTDGETVVLPAMALGSTIDLTTRNVMRGYVDHEAGHLRHSNMDLILRKYSTYATDKRALAKGLHNALEDMWLEQRVIAEYPGAKANLMATARSVNETALKKLRRKRKRLSDPLDITPYALTLEGRRRYGDVGAEEVLAMMSEEVTARLEGWVDRALKARNTSAIFEISEEIERLLLTEAAEKATEERKREKEAEASEESMSTTDSPKKAADGGHDHATPTESKEDSTHDESSGDAPRGDDAGDGRPDECSGGDERPDPAGSLDEEEGMAEVEAVRPEDMEPDKVFDEHDLAKAVEAAMKDAGLTGKVDGTWPYRPYSTGEDRFVLPNAEGDPYERHLAQGKPRIYEDMLRDLAGDANRVRMGLERALVAKTTRDWEFGQTAGRLDSRRFASALAGRDNVFKRRDDRQELDTAVTILLDLSGSMRRGPGSRGNLAMKCAIALAEALERTGVSYEVLGFNQDHAALEPKGKWSRWEPLLTWVFKPYEKRLVSCRGPMSRIEACVGNNNCDGESLMMAWQRLKERPERRKVMFVLSDGEPYCQTKMNAAHLGDHLSSVVKHLETAGCQCVGLGIQSKAVERYYPQHVVVNDLDALGSTALAMLSKLLLSKRELVRAR